jgi:ATP-dependent Clp protease ATP-binding subunit ClpC
MADEPTSAEPEGEDDEDFDELEVIVSSFARPLATGDGAPFAGLADREVGVDAIVTAIRAEPARSVVVTGDHGVGKTAVVHEAAARLERAGWSVFQATATDAMAGQSYIGQLEQRLDSLARAARGQRVLWVFPDLHEGLAAGAYREDPRGLLDNLAPYLERGDLAVLGEAPGTGWAAVLQRRPRMRNAFHEMRLEPFTPEQARELAARWADARGVELDGATLREAHELTDEYMLGRALPGSLMRLLQAALARARKADGDVRAIRPADLLAALAEETGLPTRLLDERQRLDLERVRAFFEERIVGQTVAVGVLVERIAMIKAGLTDPARPLGVFLFVGPTGTGKTELAKTLARFLFGSEDRMVRLDMSEFQTAESLERLVAGPESDASSGLIARVRKQPFSVVLLDEFEKAHPNIWDAFLQVFDDGRLTDSSGGTADFRRCVVILTSNVGSGVRSGAPVGFTESAPDASADAASDRALRRTFRPEFLNRIDRVVTFRPLTREVMRLLVRKELSDMTQRRGLRTRPWAIEWDDSAVEFLLHKGFTTDLGARPLRRAIEDHVLAPLARVIVERHVPEGDQFLFVRAPGGTAIEVQFIDPDVDEEAPPEPATPPAERTLRSVAADPLGTVEERAYLAEHLERLGTTIRTPEWEERKQASFAGVGDPEFWESPERYAVLGRAETMDRIEAGFATAESLLGRLGRATRGGDHGSPRLARLLAQRLYLLDTALAGLAAGEPADAFLRVRAVDEESEAWARRLVAMYREWARRRGMHLDQVSESGGRYETVLAVSGFGAYAILRPEAGRHVLERPAGGARAFSRDSADVLVAPQPPEPPDPRGGLAEQAARALGDAVADPTAIVRRYREEPSPLVRDSVRGWRTGRVDRVLAGDFDLL